jgi:hypothetical protein
MRKYKISKLDLGIELSENETEMLNFLFVCFNYGSLEACNYEPYFNGLVIPTYDRYTTDGRVVYLSWNNKN